MCVCVMFFISRRIVFMCRPFQAAKHEVSEVDANITVSFLKHSGWHIIHMRAW